jgi:hypothetical protein
MSSRDSELLNAIKNLNNLITTLNATIAILNSKSITPSYIDKVVSGHVSKFSLINVGATDDTPINIGETYYGLTWDGSDFYSFNKSRGVVETFKPADGAVADFCTPAFEVKAMAVNTTTGDVYLGEFGNAAAGWDARLLTYDSSGTLQTTVTISNLIMCPTEKMIQGLAYDDVNDKLYVIYWSCTGTGDNVIVSRYGEVDPDTGVISPYYNIGDVYTSGAWADYYNGMIVLGMSTELVGFVPGQYVPSFRAEMALTPSEYGTFKRETGLIYFFDSGTAALGVDAPAHIQRISIHDDGGITISVDDGGGDISIDDGGNKISIDDGAGSITVDGAVTATTIVAPSVADSNVVANDVASELVTTRSARRGLIIQNADTTDTVWVGDSGVTAATGVELLPKQTLPLNNYTGATASIYGICSAGKTVDVRILEVF